MRRFIILGSLAVLLVALSACNLTAPDPTVFPTPDMPQVTFQSPQNNAQVFENFDLVVDIVARDTTLGITRIEFYVDGDLLIEGTPPDEEVVEVFRVNMNWLAQGLGLHTLSAIAYRPDNTPSDEAIIAVEVLPREAQIDPGGNTQPLPVTPDITAAAPGS
jgi:hypothetical protein